MERKKITPADILARKSGKKITCLTAYDYPMALLIDKAEIDIALVGDSLGMVGLGYENTTPVTMDDMIHHTKAVKRGVKYALIIGDMPFGSYISNEKAVENAVRFVKEAGVDAIKLERGKVSVCIVEAIVNAGISVQGHIGLTPQTASALGGFKVQGKDAEAAKALIEDAKALEAAGCFSIVLEAIPAKIAKIITKEISIPTIGIGAGIHCDGQVLVTNDMIGLFDRFTPKFVKKYANLSLDISKAISEYKNEVENQNFPEEKHSFIIKDDELSKVY
jgi:3-methyl-2-oxobutanoate hydroxymethyltransferase